ncbi:MAG TPA: DNA polymerase III subunit gamma/tau [Candidatus Saccharimonadales bacterium]|nr:DNA polymerase III subunit gamma/tau [Candidatus Saccharimonadales bacterium]
MSQIALYRKYRSRNFDEVIGQSHIIATLSNAIASGRFSHAYLLTGPRGTGKTSVARLIARSANCTGQPQPCGKCTNCLTDIGSHLDLIEIDAASNRGIDDARALREKMSSAPSMGKYKVYIIDEVHMLTTEAFNALLKSLEEPPEHAIFILATTEAHKVPETIISRTQRFSFKPIRDQDIKSHLAAIAKKEKIQINDAALEVIAAHSRGGFRDAISLLDQLAGSGPGPFADQSVLDLLGYADPKVIEGIIEATIKQDAPAALAKIDESLLSGTQAGQLISGLLTAWRARLRASLQSQSGDLLQISGMIDNLISASKSPWPELALEAAVARAVAPVTPEVNPPATVAAAKSAPATKPPTAKTTPPVSTPVENPTGDLWMKALTQIKQRNNSLYALLRSSCNVRFEGEELILGCRFGFHRDRLKEAKNMQIIDQALSRVYGRKFSVLVQLDTAPVPAAVDSNAELMSSALEILGGEVIDG